MWTMQDEPDDYWTVNEFIDKGEWKRLAERIVELVSIMGIVEIRHRDLHDFGLAETVKYLPKNYSWDYSDGYVYFQREAVGHA